MPNQVLEKTDNKTGFFTGAMHAVEEVAKTGVKIERLKERAAHLVEDGLTDAKRMAKRGRYAAEDLVDDTAHRIKKDPWLSVGVTFGIGMGLGVMLGWLVGHKTSDN